VNTDIHPFRIEVFGTREVTKGKGKRAKTTREGYGYILWNPDYDTSERAGRPGYGSFEWYGLDVARRAALDALMFPEIDQVSIRTNQDRVIATLYKSQWYEYIGQMQLPFAA
jgi:hypothetical protein